MPQKGFTVLTQVVQTK